MTDKRSLRSIAHHVLPAPLKSSIRKVAPGIRRSPTSPATDPAWQQGTYANVYESVAQTMVPELSIGGGDYDVMGTIMLSALVDAGLSPQHTLVDFGCGTGRLTMHAVPHLHGGRYIGIDISETMLDHARERLQSLDAPTPCSVEFVQQTTPHFALADQSVDMFAAFSVFTHMEHEDAYLYLKDARRVVREGGRFVLSALTMDLKDAQTVFFQSAALSLEERWSTVRDVTTSYDYFNAVAKLAGWNVRRWYRGDRAMVPLLSDPTQRVSLGQSICILEPTAIPEPS